MIMPTPSNTPSSSTISSESVVSLGTTAWAGVAAAANASAMVADPASRPRRLVWEIFMGDPFASI
jgi:hypothetical protein